MMLEAIAIAGPASIAAGIVYLASRITQPAIGAHKLVVRHGRAEFADPADQDDPDGTRWIARITAEHQQQSPALGELVRALPAPGRLDPLPDDPPAAQTGVIPVAVSELGMTTDEYVAQAFEEAEREIGQIVKVLP